MAIRKLTIIVLLLLFSGSFVQAQNKKVSGGLGFYIPGNIQDFFPANYPDMSFPVFSSAGGGYGMFRNFIFGGQGGSASSGPFIKANRQVDLYAEFGGFDLGYIVFQKNKLMAFPLFGLNWIESDYFIHETEQSETFDRVTNQPSRSTIITHESYNLNVSLNAVYLVGGSMGEKGGGGFIIGCQLGYQLPAFKSSWSFDNGSLTDGPAFDYSGFYFRLMVGGGGIGFE